MSYSTEQLVPTIALSVDSSGHVVGSADGKTSSSSIKLVEAQSGEHWSETLQLKEDIGAQALIERLLAECAKNKTEVSSNSTGIYLNQWVQFFQISVASATSEPDTYRIHFIPISPTATAHISNKKEESVESSDLISLQLQATLNSISEGVLTTDAEGCITHTNPELRNILAAKDSQLLHDPVTKRIQFCSEQSGRNIPNPIEDVLSTRLPIGRDRGVSVRGLDGRYKSVSFHLAPIIDGQETLLGTIMVMRNITHELKMEEEVQNAQRMESLTWLSAGIAHDFNNYITSISGNISLAKDRIEKQHSAQRLLKSAESGCEYARLLVRRLQCFSTPHSNTIICDDIDRLLEECARFSLHNTEVKWQIKKPSHIKKVAIDEGQIHQLFNNLLINAVQSMVAGGTIHLEIKMREMEWPPSLNLSDGEYVLISITDEGQGIEPNMLNRLFEPYFSTKSEGTGLGLANAYNIIKNHEGHIEVDSKVGIGTCFTIYLPATNEDS